jgi:hypothetical protein
MIDRNEVQKVYDTAPQRVKDLVDSNEVFDAFHVIRKKYNLHLDHADNLAMVINALVLEMYPFEKLKDLLLEAMRSVDEGTRNDIIKDIDLLIFKPLRDKLVAETKAVEKPKTGIQGVSTARIQGVEMKLRSIPEVEIPPVPKVEQVQVTEQKVVTPPTPTQSVIAQKLGVRPVGGEIGPNVLRQDTPQPDPKTPRYHGSDPYREAPE